jgi:hypothetical protein
MVTMAQIKLPEEVKVDSSGRVTLGKSLGGKLFKVCLEKNGEIHLVPARLVADTEAWFYENKNRVESFEKSLSQSLSGDVEEISLKDLIGR